MISTRQLEYHREHRLFSGEISDLGDDKWEQVWNDSCDVGFSVHSHVTGRVEKFYVNHIESREGELLWWDLLPVGPLNCSMRIFND